MNYSYFKGKYPLVQALGKSYQNYCVISNKGKGDKTEAWKIIEVLEIPKSAAHDSVPLNTHSNSQSSLRTISVNFSRCLEHSEIPKDWKRTKRKYFSKRKKMYVRN